MDVMPSKIAERKQEVEEKRREIRGGELERKKERKEEETDVKEE